MKSHPVEALLGLDTSSRHAPKRSEVLQVLLDAQEILRAGPFVRGCDGVDGNGIASHFSHCGDLVAFSLYGALKRADVKRKGLAAWYAQRLLTRLIHESSLVDWVNHPIRKKADLFSLLKRAIRLFAEPRKPGPLVSSRPPVPMTVGELRRRPALAARRVTERDPNQFELDFTKGE